MAADQFTDATIPQWAANLGVAVARIQARTDKIPEIVEELRQLKASTVPMSEHLKLLQDVDELKRRDLGERSEWDEMKIRVPILWDERVKMQGGLITLRVIVAALGFAVVLLTIYSLLHNAGVSVSVK